MGFGERVFSSGPAAGAGGVKIRIQQDCMTPSDKEHTRQCGGKIFGCKCLTRNNSRNFEDISSANNLSQESRVKLNNLFTSKEEIDNVKNENKLINVNNFGQTIRTSTSMACDSDISRRISNFHTSSSKDSINSMLSDLAMSLCPPRSKKRICFYGTIAVIFFCIASCLPFIIEKLMFSPTVSVNIGPLANVYQQIYETDDEVFNQDSDSKTSLSDNNHKYLKNENNDILNQVFISIKTTSKYHYPRLIILLETWVSLVKDITWIFTDSDGDQDLVRRTGDHLIVTNCSSSHHRLSLCCKMEKEFEYFLKSHKQWWCHFDDDNFVNVVSLSKLIERYDSSKPWYLGKTSTASPLKIRSSDGTNSSFWFATGGAGFCLSRTLALRMAPLAVDGKFVEAGNQFWFPDDVTLGFIIESKLGFNMTMIPEFHSHLEPMSSLTQEQLQRDISFSYLLEDQKSNVVTLDGPFPSSIDPTRFYSMYCNLFRAELCPS